MTFGPFQITLVFERTPQLQIAIGGEYEHSTCAQDGWCDNVKPPIRQSRLMQLCGRSVTEARVESPQALSLFFDDGQALSLFDRDDRYEAFTVHDGDRIWIF